MSESYTLTTRDLVDNGSDLFRGTLSRLLQELRNAYVNSEGQTTSLTLPNTLVTSASDVYSRYYTVVNGLMPNSVAQSVQTLSTWQELARYIGEIDALDATLKDYTHDNWFYPVSVMSLINPPNPKEDIDSWLNRLLRVEETADLALKAQSYLSAYKRIVRISIRAGTSSCSVSPIPEPGIRSLQNGNTDYYSKLASALPISDQFNKYVVAFGDLLKRISPTMLVVTGDTVIMSRYAKQMLPASWYNLQTTITGSNANALITGQNSMKFTLTGMTSPSYQITKRIQSRSNLVISRGMNYTLNIALTSQVVSGMASVVLVTASCAGVNLSTTIGVTATRVGPNSVISLPLSVTDGLNGPEIVYTILYTSASALGAGQELHVDLEETICVSYPTDTEQLADALVSRKQVATYESLTEGARWWQYYGSQDISDSMIDPDLSLAGYIDNYVDDEFAVKIIVEILQSLHSTGTFYMRVVDNDDAAFDPSYQGDAGMAKLLSDFSEMGVSCFLSKTKIFNNGGVVSKAKMIKVFERLSFILNTLRSMFNYGEASVVDTVYTVIDPNH